MTAFFSRARALVTARPQVTPAPVSRALGLELEARRLTIS